MSHPFEVPERDLVDRLDQLVDVTFNDLQSQFLVLPRGSAFLEYDDFQTAYETLKSRTRAFEEFNVERVWAALESDALVFVVIRTILGFSPPEWADIAGSQAGVAIPQGAARTLDRRVRDERRMFSRDGFIETAAGRRLRTLVEVAVRLITQGAPPQPEGMTHRLAKADTAGGLPDVQNAARFHVPYAVVLYERYLGRPFASHRDSVSELVGDLMESAIEQQLLNGNVTYRKMGRAERVAGFDQAPDFLVPTELSPAVAIEAKLTNDDGTARDKVTRLVHLAEIRDARERAGEPSFEVVACIDGRGFGVRRQDIRRLITATRGKVFTLATLDRLIEETRLREFAS